MQHPQRPSISEQVRRRNLSINMEAYRNVYGLTIKQVARFARLPTGTWRKLEAGEIGASQQTLERVAEALDTTPEILIRPPLRRTMVATAFAIGGLRVDEIPEEWVAPFLERQRDLAKAAGHTLETLAETAEALDADPMEVLAELLRDRPPLPKTLH
jgi:transcriptional regulator with XRE-family HTH domain